MHNYWKMKLKKKRNLKIQKNNYRIETILYINCNKKLQIIMIKMKKKKLLKIKCFLQNKTKISKIKNRIQSEKYLKNFQIIFKKMIHQ